MARTGLVAPDDVPEASIKECCAWTNSKEFEVRWFHFGVGCITCIINF